jgi:hypothetical protein
LPFNRVDSICLRFGISVLAPFSILWIFLIVAAGTAPMGRLTIACLTWAAEAEMLVVLPVWLTARLVYSFYEIMIHWPAPKASPGQGSDVQRIASNA